MCRSSIALALTMAWTLFLVIGGASVVSVFGVGSAYAVTCGGLPFTKGSSSSQKWYFDVDSGTCNHEDNVAPPKNGFQYKSDKDDYYLSSDAFGSFVGNPAFTNCSISISPTTVEASFTANNCDSGNDRLDLTVNGGGTYDIVITFTSISTGAAYTVNANITFAPNIDHTVNSMSITGGTFDSPGSQFLTDRAVNLLSNQPNLVQFIDGTGGGGRNPFGQLSAYGSTSFSGSNFKMSYANSVSRVARLSQSRVEQAMAVAYKFQTKQPGTEAIQQVLAYGNEGVDAGAPPKDRVWDAWVQLYGAHSENGNVSTDFWVGYVGAHYFVTSDVIVGALAQIDYSSDENSATKGYSDGFGWMIGPYLAARLPNQPVYFEARAAWGQSNNSVSPSGGTEDDYDTTRWLASAKISGEFRIKSITVTPSLRASYFREKRDSYLDSIATLVPSQTFTIGELRWGPTFSTTIEMDDGVTITPSFGLHGIWNFAVDEAANSPVSLPDDGGLRSRIDAGLGIRSIGGLALNLNGYYDGLGAIGYEAYGGTARVGVPIQ
ncbi:MAG: autotransporter outer membrane beta-barrel domain-containing protein [Rhizobiales bacterium]|nr:autotransporter outer membrane beta-barrel domain-containing protein [Hyphomicrobiales bacterium]